MSENEEKKEIVKFESKAEVAISSTGALEPKDIEGMWRVAQIYFSSGLAPKGSNVQSVLITMAKGREIGMTLMQAMENLYVVNNKTGIEGAGALALVRASGKLESFERFYEGEEGKDSYKAVVITKRKDMEKEMRTEFSIGDAKTAGLWNKDIWKKYWKRMIYNRALGYNLRDNFSDVLHGMHIKETLDQDFNNAKTVIAETIEEPTPDTFNFGKQKQEGSGESTTEELKETGNVSPQDEAEKSSELPPKKEKKKEMTKEDLEKKAANVKITAKKLTLIGKIDNLKKKDVEIVEEACMDVSDSPTYGEELTVKELEKILKKIEKKSEQRK